MASLRARHSRKCSKFPGKETKVPDEGRIYCDCKPVYSIRHHLGENKYHHEKTKAATLSDARVELVQFERNLESGESVSLSRTLWDAWRDQWLEAAAVELSPASHADYTVTMRYATENGLAGRYLHEIRPTHVETFRRSLTRFKPATRNKHMRILHACFADALKQRLVATNPVVYEAEREGEPDDAYFMAKEVAAIAAAIPDGGYKVLFQIALRTGMRASELVTLRWVNVDLDDNLIHVRTSMSRRQEWRPKTKASRRDVYVDPGTTDLLKAWKKASGATDADLVFRRADGSPVTSEDVTKRLLYPAMKKAGVPQVHPKLGKRVFHSLRDTYAATVLGAGKSMYWLSKQLGHGSITTTERRYAHLDHEVRAQEAATLADKFAA